MQKRNKIHNNNTLNFKGTLNIIFNKTIKHVLVTTQDKNSFPAKIIQNRKRLKTMPFEKQL